MSLRESAALIIKNTVREVLPGPKTREALQNIELDSGKTVVISVGKAAWTMARAAEAVLKDRIDSGIVITKYGHVKGELKYCECFEAGHPTPDENSFLAAEKALEMVMPLNEHDNVIFLLSGGASALFEKPLIEEAQLKRITDSLLASGADITEINTVRKHVSAIKGGRFALACAPAHIKAVVLSDVIGSDLSVIGSGPVSPDASTGEDAFGIIDKYHLKVSADVLEILMMETPKELDNVEAEVIGDVTLLCQAAKNACEAQGFRTVVLTDSLDCEAQDAGAFLAGIARYYQKTKTSLAFVAGGETVVHLKGKGKGGRNQELALSAALGIAGLKDTCIFSIGSDGTDGPTDAAGGIVDGETIDRMKENRIDARKMLEKNDSYNALQAVQGLIVTGPTGTNVNDVAVVLIKR